MFKDVTIGQYYPENSIIHRLDPRTKISFTFIYIIALFLINNFLGYIFAFLFLWGIIKLSKIPVSYILRGIKALVFIIMFTVIINLFITPGEPIFTLGFLSISEEGLNLAVFMALRLIFLV